MRVCRPTQCAVAFVAVAVAINDQVNDNDYVIDHANPCGRAQRNQTRLAARKRKARKFRASFSKRMAMRLNRLMR